MKSIYIAVLTFATLLLCACSTAPKLDRFSAKYMSCDAKDLKPVEITNHGWYQSWYVDCKGQEYYCRYNKDNENGWNGCHASSQSSN